MDKWKAEVVEVKAAPMDRIERRYLMPFVGLKVDLREDFVMKLILLSSRTIL